MRTAIFIFSLGASANERTFEDCNIKEEGAERSRVAAEAPIHLYIGTPLIRNKFNNNYADIEKNIKEIMRIANNYLSENFNFRFDLKKIQKYEHNCPPGAIAAEHALNDFQETMSHSNSDEFHHLFTDCEFAKESDAGIAIKADSISAKNFCSGTTCTGITNYQELREKNDAEHKFHIMDALTFLHEVGHNFGAWHEDDNGVSVRGIMADWKPTTYLVSDEDRYYVAEEADFSFDEVNGCYVRKMINHALEGNKAGFRSSATLKSDEKYVEDSSDDVSQPDEGDDVSQHDEGDDVSQHDDGDDVSQPDVGVHGEILDDVSQPDVGDYPTDAGNNKYEGPKVRGCLRPKPYTEPPTPTTPTPPKKEDSYIIRTKQCSTWDALAGEWKLENCKDLAPARKLFLASEN